MNINTLKTKKEDNEIQVNRTTLEDIFNRELEIGKYKFRLKKIKGKDLFALVTKFGFSNTTDTASKFYGKDFSKLTDKEIEEITSEMYSKVYNSFIDNFDFAMKYLQFSVNNGEYSDLIINGIYQVEEVETNIMFMYKLVFFIYQAALLFMEISQQ